MIVYRMTNRMTRQSYIGTTTQALHYRMSNHRANAERGVNYPLCEAIRTFGWEAFDVEVIARCVTKEEMHAKEEQAIALFGTMTPNGYNLTANGRRGPVSEATKAKMSQRLKGRKPVRRSAEAQERINEAHRGAKNKRARAIRYRGTIYSTIREAAQAHGLSVSQMWRRIGKGLAELLTPSHVADKAAGWGQWNLGKKHSAEARERIGATRRGGLNWNSRRVDLAGVEYPSLKEAAESLGLSRGQIYRRIRRGDGTFLNERRLVQ